MAVPSRQVSTLIVLGSGGHTAEMLTLAAHLDKQHYSPRCYVVAATDRMGEAKANAAEACGRGVAEGQACVCKIPRSREVGQSYVSSVWTTLVALCAAFSVVFSQRPELVLVNGPGTCVPICLAALVYRLVLWRRCLLVYVESIARVDTLSLSGKILYRIADCTFVQWPQLQRKYPRTLCVGRLY
ncbi:hypothetical protein WJX81_005535 [Elliptochloris bilobata]|uniref:UDP-N-acetylglucosamine transferase subunit ALG14 n=1 Tax=Elliptochloris bilobata TaxID=381761 RepID=A0AAW1S7N2_9CHLO